MTEHQRGRLHAATIELVAERGYDALTVAAIVERAGVSKRTFYENFKGKEDCFLETYRVIVRSTARDVLSARRGERGSQAQVRAGFLSFSRQVTEQPRAARLALVSVLEVGGGGSQARLYTSGLFEALVAESMAAGDEEGHLPPLLVKAVVAGTMRVARTLLSTGQGDDPQDIADALMAWVFALRSEVAVNACIVGVHPAAGAMAKRSGGLPRLPGPVRDDLIGDERAMVLSAVAHLATEGRYDALTVPGIRGAAGISRQCFDRHFDSVAECLIATIDRQAWGILEEARAAFSGAEDWAVGIYLVLSRLCECLAHDPVLGAFGALEAAVAGTATLEWEAKLVHRLRELLRCVVPPRQWPADAVAEASVGAGLALVVHYLGTGRARRLPSIAGALTYLVLAPSIGAQPTMAMIDHSRRGRTSTIARIDDQERFGRTS